MKNEKDTYSPANQHITARRTPVATSPKDLINERTTPDAPEMNNCRRPLRDGLRGWKVRGRGGSDELRYSRNLSVSREENINSINSTGPYRCGNLYTSHTSTPFLSKILAKVNTLTPIPFRNNQNKSKTTPLVL